MKSKQDIINQIHDGSSISKKTIEQVVQSFILEIRKELVSGEDVRIRGLGTFKVVTRKAHVGRNPSTGEEIKIPERTVPQMKFSSSIAKEMNS